MKQFFFIIFFTTIIVLISACDGKTSKNIVFDEEYPPLREVEYSVDGQTLNIEVFEGQCILFFEDNITHQHAKNAIEQNGGKIIEQLPSFNYYLVKVPAGKENDFILRMKDRNDVQYCFFNTPCELNSHVYILDNFNGYRNDSALISHGDCVKRTFLKYGMGRTLHLIDIGIPNSNSVDGKKKKNAIQYITAVNQQFPKLSNIITGGYDQADDVVLINMSFSTKLYGKKRWDDLFKDVSKSCQNSYIYNYTEDLKVLSIYINKMRSKGFSNFIITNASGNEGFYNLDDIFNKLDDSSYNSLRKNIVFVNAFDQKEKVWYTNLPSKKHELSTTINITEEDWSGTSCAAPKLLGFIDKVMTEYKKLNAQDVLQAIRNATPVNPREPMTYEMLEREAKKLSDRQCKQYSFVLDMTSDYNGEWDLSEGKNKDIVKYQVHNTYGYKYLSGKEMAIDLKNCTDYNIDIFLNALDSERDIRPMRYYMEVGERESFYAYNQGSMEIISVNKLQIIITTW